MSHTVKANSRPVCTKGTGDEAVSTNDACYTADDKLVVFGNLAYTKNLGTGQTSTVFIQQQPVWNQNGRLDAADSDPAHAGVKGGQKTGTYRGWCKPTSFSPDVIVEGGGVVRINDATLQNSGNCDGKVVPGGMGGAVAEAANQAAQAALEDARTAAKKALDEGKAPDTAQQEGADQTDQQADDGEEQSLEQCAIVMARIEDAEGRGVEESGTLEIVPPTRGSDTITCTGELAGACPEEPTWTAQGVHHHEAVGLSTSFAADAPSIGPRAWLAGISPGTTNVTFTSQVDSRSFTIKTYPADKLRVELKVPETLHTIVNFLGKVLHGASGGDGIKVVGPNFSGFVEAQWAEVPGSPEAFYKYTIAGGGTPVFGLQGDQPIPCPLAPLAAFLRLLRLVGVKAGFYIGVDISKRLVVAITRDTPAPPHIEVNAQGRNRIEAKFKIEVGAKGTVKAEFGARSTLHVNLKGTLRGMNPAIEIQVVIDPLEGYIKIVWGKRNFQDIVKVFDTVKIPSSPAVIDLTKLFR